MVPHDEHDPLALREARNLPFEHLPDLARIRAIFGPRPLFRSVEQPPLGLLSEGRGRGRGLSASVIDAGIHDDTVQPGRELGVLAKAIQRPVDLEEDLLGDVLGVVVVAGKLVGHPIDHGPMPLDEHLKGGRVTARRAGNQVRVNHSAPCQRI